MKNGGKEGGRRKEGGKNREKGEWRRATYMYIPLSL